MAGFQESYGKSLGIEQLFIWGVLGEFIRALGTPGFVALSQFVNSIQPSSALSVADAIEATVKGHLDEHTAQVEASYGGIDERRFKVLLDSAGEPPGLETMLEAFRRGFIERAGTGADSTALEQGIRESRLKNKWISVIERMGLRPIPLSEAIDAWVEGQITPEQAQEIAYHNGVSREDAVILYNTRGRPVSPGEAIEMVRRRKIPMRGTGPDALSLQQAIYEGATKNKWEPVFEQLVEYHPPPRTVTALLRSGSIDDQTAARLLQDAGLSPELAAAYIANAHHGRTASHKELSVTTILDLYEQRVLKPEDASKLLQDLGYSASDADYVMALKDLQREIKAVSAATSRIGQLYIGRKIERAVAVTTLNELRIPDSQITELLTIWDQERAATVKLLTAAEIVAAHHWGIFDQATATQELVNLGYTAFDAWALLSIRQHEALPGRPAG